MSILKKLDKLKKYVPESKVGRRFLAFFVGIVFVIPAAIAYLQILGPYIPHDNSVPYATTDMYVFGLLPVIILATISVTYINLLLKRGKTGAFTSVRNRYFCIIVTPFLWLPFVLVIFILTFDLIVGNYGSSTISGQEWQPESDLWKTSN